MKLQFLTINIDGKCFDLPKDMQIPQIGSTVFIEGKTGVVEDIQYHIVDGRVHMISIFASRRHKSESPDKKFQEKLNEYMDAHGIKGTTEEESTAEDFKAGYYAANGEWRGI